MTKTVLGQILPVNIEVPENYVVPVHKVEMVLISRGDVCRLSDTILRGKAFGQDPRKGGDYNDYNIIDDIEDRIYRFDDVVLDQENSLRK